MNTIAKQNMTGWFYFGRVLTFVVLFIFFQCNRLTEFLVNILPTENEKNPLPSTICYTSFFFTIISAPIPSNS